MDVNKLWVVLLACLVQDAIASVEEDLEDSDPCTQNPCENDAACTVSDKKLFCICKPQFFGPTCEFNSCEPNPCRNNGRCENDDGEAYCICNEPYYGPKCEEVLDLCHDYTCLNDGKCRMEGDKIKCDCVGPFIGDVCDINVCDPNPCQNNGTCTVAGNNFTCACQEPFTGLDCTSVKEYCLEDTCKNGGACKMENGQYKCVCGKKYSGKNCEIESAKAIKNLDYCYIEPCQNDGTCQNDENMDDGYKCECKAPYKGKNCDEKIPASTVADITSSVSTTKLIDEDNASKITRTEMVSNLTTSSNYEVEKHSTLSYTSEGITKTESELIPNVTSSENYTTHQEITTASLVTQNSTDVVNFNTTFSDVYTSIKSTTKESEWITQPTVNDFKINQTKKETPDVSTSSSTVIGLTGADTSETSTAEIKDPKSTIEQPIIIDEGRSTSIEIDTDDLTKMTMPRLTSRITTSKIVDPKSTLEPTFSEEERNTNVEIATDPATKTNIPKSTDSKKLQKTTEEANTMPYKTTSISNTKISSISDKVTPITKFDVKVSTINLSSNPTTVVTSSSEKYGITNITTSTQIDHNNSTKTSAEPTTEDLSMVNSTDQTTIEIIKADLSTLTIEGVSSTIMTSTVPVSSEDESIFTSNPSRFVSSTKQTFYPDITMFTTVTELTTSSSTDKDLAIEIRSGKSSPKTAVYVCGGISAFLGIFLLVSGIVYYSKRVRTKKRLQYFYHADSSSVGSADSASNLA